jgi:ribosome-associated translation inhibitor RaiA
MMRIAVIGRDVLLDDQMRAYGEYKVFLVLAPYARHIDHVEVVVEECSTDLNGAEARCTIMVTLAPAGRERVRARGSRAYSAIDSAAARLKEVMQSRRAAPLLS